MNVKIGKRIKALRNRDDVTQDMLAEALGVTGQAISKWENETGYPDIELIAPIANFFNVTIDELFDHDKEEKARKIKAYCDKYDEMFRSWEPVDDRISIMRQALAEYPAEEELLVRLGIALWYKWDESLNSLDIFSLKDGKVVYNFDVCRAQEGWEEPVRIFEGLIATSVNDIIRSDSHRYLSYIYGTIGEKEKVYQIAEQNPHIRDKILFAALNGKYEDEARVSSQSLMLGALFHIYNHLPMLTKDFTMRAKAYERIIELFQFVFYDGNYGFYNSRMKACYSSYAELLIRQNKTEEAITALEKAFEYAKQFDTFLDKLRSDGEYCYTSEFVDSSKEKSVDVYAKKSVPEFLNNELLDEGGLCYKVLHGNPRYDDLVKRVEEEINK